MKKSIILLVFLIHACHFNAHASTPRRGVVNIRLDNGTSYRGFDLLVDSDCRVTPGDPISIKKGETKVIPLNFTGNVCKLIVTKITNESNAPIAVVCLDADGCHTHCLNSDPDCAYGACDSEGLGWLRGGDRYYGHRDTCVRRFPDKYSSTDYIYYSLVRPEITPVQAAEMVFRGGDIALFLEQNFTGDNYRIITEDKGIKPYKSPASNYREAISNFNEMKFWMEKSGKDSTAFTAAFCDYALNNDYAIQLKRNNPGSTDTDGSLNRFCKGAPAPNGFFWNNPPYYQVKCQGRATPADDKSGCVCRSGGSPVNAGTNTDETNNNSKTIIKSQIDCR